MKWIGIVFLGAMICAGCETAPQEPTSAEWRAKLHTVNLSDGVSADEARIIGQCYFKKNIACGVFFGVHDGGDRWIVDAGFGVGGLPVHDFYIMKNTGKVVSSIGPSYDNPLEIYP